MIHFARSGTFSKPTEADWEVLSYQLPTTFVWLLNLICQIIEEPPKMVYAHLCSLESVIFQKHSKLLYTITDAKLLKHRLVQALRALSQCPLP